MSFRTKRTTGPWKIVSVTDYTGDGKPDLIWHSAKSGDVVYWQMIMKALAG